MWMPEGTPNHEGLQGQWEHGEEQLLRVMQAGGGTCRTWELLKILTSVPPKSAMDTGTSFHPSGTCK